MGELVILQGESVNWQFLYTDQEGTPLDIEYHTVAIAAVEEFGLRKLLFKYDTINDPSIIEKEVDVLGTTNVRILDTSTFKVGRYLLEMSYKNTVTGMITKPDQVRLIVEKGIL